MNIHGKTIRRITLTGPIGGVKEALSYAYRNGYSTVVSGPMPIARFRYDTTRYRIVAEKRVNRVSHD